MRLIRLLLIVTVLVVFAQLVHFRLLYIMSYAMLGLLALAFIWTHLSVRFLRLERTLATQRAQVGENIEETISLINTGLLPKLWVEVRDESDLPNHRVSCVQSLAPFGTARWRARTMCTLRGRFTLGPVTVSVGDPFGIFRVKRRFNVASHVLVLPAVFDLDRFEGMSGALPGGGVVSNPTHHTTPHVQGLRDYQPGDGFNRIHWPSLARQGKLIVKEFEFDPTQDVQIFLDLNASAHFLINHNAAGANAVSAASGVRSIDSTEEYAITAVASLAKHFLDRGRSVGLIAWGQYNLALPPDRGERQLHKILEELASVRALGNQEFGQLLTSELPRLNLNDTVVMITPDTSGEWVGSLPHLLQRHITPAAVVIDPGTFGAPSTAVNTVSALATLGVPTYVLRRGETITEALAVSATAGVVGRV